MALMAAGSVLIAAIVLVIQSWRQHNPEKLYVNCVAAAEEEVEDGEDDEACEDDEHAEDEEAETSEE